MSSKDIQFGRLPNHHYKPPIPSRGTMDDRIQQALASHPCFNEEAHRRFARMHIPVAPKCNIQCNYCNRKYDCSNESRPGVTSEVLTPEQAVEKVRAVKARIPELSVIGIAGPGDPLANEETFRALELIGKEFPDLTLCVSTNGLALPGNSRRLYDLGVRFVTVTMNAVDPEVGAKVYEFVRGPDGTLKGTEAARLLIERQLQGAKECVDLGMVVKINIVMIPGINDAHIPELVKRVKELGAYIVNILPLIPVDGTRFSDLRAPTPQERKELMDLCGLDIRMMRHCRQCRADAIGKLGEDRSQEFRGCGCGPADDDEGVEMALKVKDDSRIAVATTDGVNVDGGFGNAREFRIYDLRDGGLVEVDVRRASDELTVRGTDHKAHLRGIASMLSDCGTVVVLEIGPLAEKMLNAHGVRIVLADGPFRDALRNRAVSRGCACAHTSVFIGRPIVTRRSVIMDAQQMRDTYVDFFKSKGHAYIRSAPLIPENDPTVLFTTAGMHPLVPYLLGQKHPAGKRLVDFQKCVRTGDIDEVGDASHLTFFEMLGNWSLGDYFKKESIAWSYELLTDVLKFDPDHLAVTAFEGEGDIPRDTETAELWKSHGLRDDQIYFYGREDNWWGPAGQTGPCGPDTEIFYDDGRPKCGPNCGPSCHCGKFTEIWNNVFMQYNKNADGTFTPLSQKNVDTGMGLERVIRILNGKETVYDTPLFAGIIGKVEELSGKKYGSDEETTRAFRIIADHLRAATFILGDGVVPAKIGQGYILRRLIRRASRYLSKLGVDRVCMREISEVIVSEYSAAYPELERNKDFIYTNITAEEEKFQRTLTKGLRRFNEMVAEHQGEYLDGEKVFHLYDTFGFPIELTQELAAEKGLKVDLEDFDKRFKTHQDASRGDGGTFKGGLADHSEETTKLHTATHLLNAALRKFVSPDIHQKGSNITAERLRFDFNLDRKCTPEELKQIEDWVNEQIRRELDVVCVEMPYEQAREEGVEGVFTEKYGEIVKVYRIGDVSAEMCGGPHVSNTRELQGFKIKKEESSAAGVRRIKAVVGKFD